MSEFAKIAKENVVKPLQTMWLLGLNIKKQICSFEDASAVALPQTCALVYSFSGTVSMFHNTF